MAGRLFDARLKRCYCVCAGVQMRVRSRVDVRALLVTAVCEVVFLCGGRERSKGLMDGSLFYTRLDGHELECRSECVRVLVLGRSSFAFHCDLNHYLSIHVRWWVCVGRLLTRCARNHVSVRVC